MRRVVLPFAALAAALAALATAPAGAVDDVKPVACHGLAFADPAGDNTSTAVPSQVRGVGTDLIGGFVKHDPAKGDQASTFNLVVADLSKAVPPGYVTITWNAFYPAKDEPTRWVRAVADFGGGVAFEYGHVENAQATTVSLYEGDIEGKLFEGPEGVVQLVMPKGDVVSGDELKPVYGNILQGQASLPPQTGAPVRGTSWVMDRGPDNEGAANKVATVKECPSDEAPPPPAADPGPIATGEPAPTPTSAPPGSSPPPPPPPPTTATPTGSRALPVTLVTKSVRAKRVGKVLVLRLRSSERVTNIAAQLRKGTKRVGTGKLASLDRTGRVRLKLAKFKKGRKLARGGYVVDFAGNDASGKRLLASFRLRVK